MIRKAREWLENKIFYTAWILLHIAYQLQLEVRDYLSFNFKCLKSRLWSCFPLYSQEAALVNYVESVQRLPKLPQHIAIAVIPKNKESVLSSLLQQLWALLVPWAKPEVEKKPFSPEEINLQELAKVVAWASAANIPIISLYDYHGILKARFKELGCYIQEELQQDFWAVKQSRSVSEPPVVKFHNLSKTNGYTNGTNGSKPHQVLNIMVYSRQDGKPAIVKTAKEMCGEKGPLPTSLVPGCKVEKLNEEIVDACVNKCIGWPSSLSDAKTDPELMVILGNVKSTMGFLPWHIRLTEIHWLPPLPRVDLEDFHRALHKYSRCQQRFGT